MRSLDGNRLHGCSHVVLLARFLVAGQLEPHHALGARVTRPDDTIFSALRRKLDRNIFTTPIPPATTECALWTKANLFRLARADADDDGSRRTRRGRNHGATVVEIALLHLRSARRYETVRWCGIGNGARISERRDRRRPELCFVSMRVRSAREERALHVRRVRFNVQQHAKGSMGL